MRLAVGSAKLSNAWTALPLPGLFTYDPARSMLRTSFLSCYIRVTRFPLSCKHRSLRLPEISSAGLFVQPTPSVGKRRSRWKTLVVLAPDAAQPRSDDRLGYHLKLKSASGWDFADRARLYAGAAVALQPVLERLLMGLLPRTYQTAKWPVRLQPMPRRKRQAPICKTAAAHRSTSPAAQP